MADGDRVTRRGRRGGSAHAPGPPPPVSHQISVDTWPGWTGSHWTASQCDETTIKYKDLFKRGQEPERSGNETRFSGFVPTGRAAASSHHLQV